MKQLNLLPPHTAIMKSIFPYFPLRSLLLSFATFLTVILGISYVTLVGQNARADNPPTATIAFDSIANNFELTINTTHETSYLLSYVHTDFGSYTQEGVTGSGSDTAGVVKKTIYAGTCSATECIGHDVQHGLVKVNVPDLNWHYLIVFSFDSNHAISTLKEGFVTSSDITTQEQTWMDEPTSINLSDIVVAAPVATYTPSPVPTLTPLGTPTPTPDVLFITPTVTPTVEAEYTPTATPTVTPTGPELLDESIRVDIVQSEPSFVDTVLHTLLPFLYTDKPDYAPTEKAVISGKDFLPNTDYSIIVTSTDAPPVTHTASFVSLTDGTFTYEYQLDGIYRPNYAVEIQDATGTTVATATFTDSRTVNSATLNGSASVIVTSTEVISAAVTVNHTGGDNNWQSTGWRIGTSGAFTCVDHVDHNSSGTQTETFNVTAPSAAGTYTIQFQAYNNNTCSSGSSATFGLTNSITVDTTPPLITITNPNISPATSKTITATTNEGTLTLFVNAVGVTTCNSSLSFVAYTSKTFSAEADNGRYVCYRAVDTAGNITYLLSNAIGGIDRTAPTVVISSTSTNPTNANPILVTFTFNETVTGFTSSDVTVVGGTKGTFTPVSGTIYTLNIAPTAATVTINVGAGLALDLAGNGNTAATQLSRTFDNTPPIITITNPSTSPATSKTITASTNEGTLNMFVNAVGVTTCDSSLVFVAYASRTFSTESDNGKYVCYRAVDAAGNTTYSISNAIGGIDATAPTITNISSSDLDGAYTVGQTVHIQVTFSEPVTVNGILFFNAADLKLETGATDRYASYASGSGTNTLTFNYTVQSGDISADLDYFSSSALSTFNLGQFVWGTIQDGVGHDADLTLPAPGATHSLGANKNIVVGITPAILTVVTPVSTPSNSTTPSFTFNTTKAGTITYAGDCASSTTIASSGNNTVIFNSLSTGTHTNCTLSLKDSLGVTSNVLAVPSFTIDSDAPTIDAVSPIVVEATGPSGAIVTITPPTSHDLTDGNLSSICDHSTGTFPIGITTVTCSKTDSSGNVAVPSIFTVTVQDTTAPSVPTNGAPHNISIPTNNFDFTWDNSTDATTVTYEFQSSLDSTSVGGILTNGLWHSGILPTAMIHSSGAPDGKWYWQVRAIDALGNTSAWSTIWNVTLDIVSPTVDLVFPTPGPSATSFQAVFSENVKQSEAEDPANYFLQNWPGYGGSGDLVGDATISYNSLTKTATISFTNPGWYVSPEQQWGVQNVHDLAGNVLAVSPYTEYSTPLISPVTVDSGADTNWHNTTVTVTLSCSDVNGSGCKNTYYTTDGTVPTTSSSVGNSIVLSTDGTYTIKYFSVDIAGNQESIKTASNVVKIDKTNPTLILKSTFSGWHAADQLSTFTFSDVLSGIASGTPVTCTISTEGTGQTCSVKPNVCDVAGNCNTTPVTSNGADIDKTNPSSTISLPSNSGNNSVIYSNSWSGAVSGAATDATSGVNGVQVSIQKGTTQYFDGSTFVDSAVEILLTATYAEGSWQYTGLTSPDEATYTVKSHAIDNATNMESTYSLTIVLDKTIPQIAISLNPAIADASDGWYKTQPEVTLTATDVYFDRIEYQWDSQTGPWITYTAPFKPATEGARVLYYRARDLADNYSGVGIKNIKWNKTDLKNGPLNVSVSPNPTSEFTSKVKWDAATSDTIGIDRYEVQWRLKNGDKSYTASVGNSVREYTVDNLLEGIWEVKVTAFDASGNSKSASVDLTVDRTGPSAPTLSVTGTTVGSVSLSWTKISDAVNYIIWYGTTPGTYLYGARVGDIQSYTVQGLGGGTYYFIVRAVDGTGNQSGNSNQVSSGSIIGAPGVGLNTPAQGFNEEVLGANTLSPTPTLSPTATPTPVAGEVLGSETRKSNKPWWWPWILLLLLPIGWFGYKKWKNRKE